MPRRVVAYMTNWCPDCTRARRVLERSGVPYSEIDIDAVSGAEEAMRAVNGGSSKVPTIWIDGRILIEPSDEELANALGSVAAP